MVFAIASGLACQTGMNDGTVVAFLGLDNWRIHLPVTPTEKRLTSKGDRGIVTVRREILNQRDEIVHSMDTTLMYLRRPEAS